MDAYVPPYHISARMLALVAAIAEKVGRVDSAQGLSARPQLRRNNRIQSIHASLQIEANSLSLTAVRDVIDGRPVLGDRREIQEVKNAYAAYDRLEQLNPFSLTDLKETHRLLTQFLLPEAGSFRRGGEGVFAGGRCIFMAPPPQRVPELMGDLFVWLQQSRNTLHPLLMAAIFHYEFVFIHPFADGNGRLARLWHTALLYQWHRIFAYLPLESQIAKFQQAYYDAIAQCHVQGNSDVFIEFMLERIDSILAELLTQLGQDTAELAEEVKRLLAAMEPGVPYTARALLEVLGLKSRDNLRRNYLKPALEAGLVKMTVPAKPNSRNQRYVRQL